MKACVLEANNKIVIKDLFINEPNANEVTVKIVSCGICGSDIPRYFFNGAHGYPIILGHEFYGKIIKLGPGVQDYSIGDDVVGVPLVPCFECDDCKEGNFSLCKNYKFIGSSLNGAYCEELNINVKNVFKIDKSIANPYCAMFEPSSIGLHAIKMFNDYKNKNVAIIGGGTIGIMLAEWARIYGASNTILFVRRTDNNRLYETMGINELMISNEDNIDESKKKYTNAKGFDFVFDAVGSNSTIIYALKIAKNRGNVCYVGTPTSQIKFEKKEWEIINRKELLITGSWMSYSNPFPGSEWIETNQALIDGKLSFKKELFSSFFELEKVNEAFDFIKAGKNGNVGRVCLITNYGKKLFSSEF